VACARFSHTRISLEVNLLTKIYRFCHFPLTIFYFPTLPQLHPLCLASAAASKKWLPTYCLFLYFLTFVMNIMYNKKKKGK